MSRNVIKVNELIGSEGRSRTNVAKLRLNDIPASVHVVLDFYGVEFLSRSFTDEIISQMQGRQYTIENANEIVANMFKAVAEGRSKSREHNTSSADVKSFKSLVELSRYLNMIM